MRKTISVAALVLGTATSLSSCDWVDSTGLQAGTATATSSSSRINLYDTEAFTAIEQVPIEIELADTQDNEGNWRWVLSENEGDSCSSVPDFDQQYAATSLEAACADNSNCQVSIERVSGAPDTQFSFRMPALRSPVQLQYQVVGTSDENALVVRSQTVCALSVNEAPQAEDDHYLVLNGQARVTGPDDPDNLLANDFDDIDTSNAPLRVNPTPVSMPRHASHFELYENGGFMYSPEAGISGAALPLFEDSFTYSVSDGYHSVQATATIRFVEQNEAPAQNEPLKEIQLQPIGDGSWQASIDLDAHFTDPDENPLYYSAGTPVSTDDLSVSITNSSALVLKTEQETDDAWIVEVLASDGLSETKGTFIAYINLPAAVTNSKPLARDIKNRRFSGVFEYDVSEFFSDPDGDELAFSAFGLPQNVLITPAGLIAGEEQSNNRGNWLVTVTATDTGGLSVSDAFRLIIQ